jgi:hypothetical protein
LSGDNNDILKDYTAAMYKLNEEVCFRMKGAEFRAKIEGVSPEGALLTSHPVHGRLSWGSVEWLI